jgi:hypothetical protein
VAVGWRAAVEVEVEWSASVSSATSRRAHRVGVDSRNGRERRGVRHEAGKERISLSPRAGEAGGKALRRMDVRGSACAWVVWRRWVGAEAVAGLFSRSHAITAASGATREERAGCDVGAGARERVCAGVGEREARAAGWDGMADG